MSDEDVAKNPIAGSLFACRPGVTGLAPFQFAG